MPELLPIETADVRICSCRDNEICGDCSHVRGPKPPTAPNWADVFRAMHKAGLRLVKSERISKNWTHRSLVDRGVEAGDVAVNQHGDRFVSLHGADGWNVEMKNPTPAKVFEAARLVGLGGDSDER